MRGASIQIGAGAVLAGIVGFWNGSAAFGFLIALGVFLLLHGIYDDFIKPRFRVERRLTDWLMRRGWSVSMKRQPQFNFLLHISSASSEYEVIVTRNKQTYDDLIGFTGKVPMHPMWLDVLPRFSQAEREILLSEIRVYVTAKNLSYEVFTDLSSGQVFWPPVIAIQTAIAQDHTLSQHSVDITAKSVELTMIGVRDVIRKAVTVHAAMNRMAASQPPSPEPTPDTEEPQPQPPP